MRGKQVGNLEGWVLFKDAVLLEKRRQWNASDLKYKDKNGNVLVGAVDDILESSTGRNLVAPFDVKTKGSKPDLDYCTKYYQTQLDVYALLLSQKHEVAMFGALYYFWPVECSEREVKFEFEIFVLNVSPQSAIDLFNEAIELLTSHDIPEASVACEYCNFYGNRRACVG